MMWLPGWLWCCMVDSRSLPASKGRYPAAHAYGGVAAVRYCHDDVAAWGGSPGCTLVVLPAGCRKWMSVCDAHVAGGVHH